MRCVFYYSILLLIFLGSCAHHQEVLKVSSYHLKLSQSHERFLSGEKNKYLYGAVSQAERKAREGHYFTVRWKARSRSAQTPARLVFEYRQSGTGNTIHRTEKTFTPPFPSSTIFQITGANYQTQGNVTSWQFSYYLGERLIEQKRSYLWR